MPPVSNRPLYMYRVFIKWISFFVFGLGTLLLIFPVIPVMLLFFRPNEKFQQYARRFVSASFRGFVFMMRGMGIVELKTGDREVFKKLASKIVVANHPSLLDVVMLISLIPNADVIVRGNLIENIIVSGVVRRLYILNSLNFEELAGVCKASLARGNCIVIFPEGTRTPRSGQMRLKKGAARLSLLLGADIIAVHIGGTDKYGLGKHDPFTAFNHTEKYIYNINIRGCLNPEKYAGMEMPRAVRRLNAEILDILQKPEDL
ncbi:1-acyl-sn-glycerol-3-phosphate acyltransferase [Spirochaetia bacterium]|nr:1-acyl-sn-glycerol-3-phosphate acyltransferase [Spirochaetia bacterium]